MSACTAETIGKHAIMKLSPQDLHVLKLWENYKSHDLQESLREYHFLVDTLIYVHEVISKQSIQIKHWQKRSETLLYKFFFHGLTIHNILRNLLYIKNTIARKCKEDHIRHFISKDGITCTTGDFLSVKNSHSKSSYF